MRVRRRGDHILRTQHNAMARLARKVPYALERPIVLAFGLIQFNPEKLTLGVVHRADKLDGLRK
jgi:hypothetical protein